MKISITHGSPEKFDKLKYFNLSYDQNTKVGINLDSGEPINLSGSGLDQNGIGAYFLEGILPKESMAFSTKSGYSYIYSLDVDEFSNEASPDLIEAKDWVKIIEGTVGKIQKLEGFDLDKVDELADKYILFHTDIHSENLSEKLEDLGLDVDDGIPSDDDEFCDWIQEKKQELLDLHDPCANVYEHFGCYGIGDIESSINNLINKSDSLWDLKSTIEASFTYSDGTKYTSYNRFFYESFKETIGHHPSLVAAKIEISEGTNHIVCFDLDSLTLEKVIDISKYQNIKNDNSMEP